MLCFINKWFISRTLDTGKALPGFVNRHLGRCKECRAFSRLSGSLARRLPRDAAEFLRQGDNSLNERIKSALVSAPGRVKPTPASFPQRRRPLFAPVPLLAAALLVLAAAIGIILQMVPSWSPGTGQDLLNGLPEFEIGETPLQDLVGRVESPMESEMNGLKQTVNLAAKFLISCLDIKINQE